jgi:hypothetical protein
METHTISLVPLHKKSPFSRAFTELHDGMVVGTITNYKRVKKQVIVEITWKISPTAVPQIVWYDLRTLSALLQVSKRHGEERIILRQEPKKDREPRINEFALMIET